MIAAFFMVGAVALSVVGVGLAAVLAALWFAKT